MLVSKRKGGRPKLAGMQVNIAVRGRWFGGGGGGGVTAGRRKRENALHVGEAFSNKQLGCKQDVLVLLAESAAALAVPAAPPATARNLRSEKAAVYEYQ